MRGLTGGVGQRCGVDLMDIISESMLFGLRYGIRSRHCPYVSRLVPASMNPLLVAGLAMILLHRADGGEVAVSRPRRQPARQATDANGPNKLVASRGALRDVVVDDGKLIAVMETCDVVKKLLGEADDPVVGSLRICLAMSSSRSAKASIGDSGLRSSTEKPVPLLPPSTTTTQAAADHYHALPCRRSIRGQSRSILTEQSDASATAMIRRLPRSSASIDRKMNDHRPRYVGYGQLDIVGRRCARRL